MGVGPEDFATLAYVRARQRRDVRIKHRLLFVECAAPIAATFAQAIQERLNVEVTPVMLSDLQQPTPGLETQIRGAQMVVTTFFHLQEVRKWLAPRRKRVVGLGLKPHLEKLMQIAAIPKGTLAVGICISDCSAHTMKQTLENAGITDLDASACGVQDRQKLIETLAGRSVAIVSDLVADEVQSLLQPGQELITLNYLTLDEAGINLIESILEEMSDG